MKFNNVLNNFSSGHWSPRMLSATNEEAYQRACAILKNNIALKQGGIYKRPGLLWKDLNASSSDAYTRMQTGDLLLIPFGGSILVCHTGIPYDAGMVNGWFFINADTGAFTNMIGGQFSSATGNYASPNIAKAQYVSLDNKIFIVSQDGPPRVIELNPDTLNTEIRVVNGDANKYTGALNNYTAHPYQSVNALGTGYPNTLTASATSGAITLTASQTYWNTAKHVGTFVKLTSAGVTGVARITSVTSGTVANASVIVTLPGAVAYGITSGTSWEQSHWSSGYGWPTSICTFQQRLFIGRGDRVWGSAIGDYEKFMEVPRADDPDFSTFAADNSRPFTIVPSIGASGGSVQALGSTKVLMIEFLGFDVIAKGTQGALGPNDIQLESHSSYGALPIQMTKSDEFLTYVQRTGKSVRDIVFSYENEQYRSIDIAFMADDYFTGKTVKRLVSCVLNGTTVLFVLFTNGTVICSALDRERGIVSWSELEFPGTNASVVELGCCTSGNSDYSDSIYFIVSRTINGSTVRYLEKLADIFDRTTYGNSDMYYYMDSVKIISSPGSVTVNVGHLIGETVHVFGDGAYLGTKVVSGGGTITLDAIYTKVVAGLLYTSRLVPAPLNMPTQSGGSAGMVKKVTSLTIKFWNSITAKYGNPTTGEMYEILTRSSNVIASTNVPLFTGDQRVQFPPGYDRNKLIEIKSDLPFPCNILSIAVDGAVYD